MKVGIYNTYVNTMGGGEKHMGAIAEYFSHQSGVHVDIISEKYVDINELSKKLQLSLENCSVVTLDDQGLPIEVVSQEYDLFINSTHYSDIKPRGKKNALLLFFPILPHIGFLARSRFCKKMLTILDRSSNIFFEKGFYTKEKVGKYLHRKFGYWTQKEFSFRVNVPNKIGIPQTIKIKTGGLRQSDLTNMIHSVCTDDADQVSFQTGHRYTKIIFTPKKNEVHFQIQLASVFEPKNNDTRRLGIFVMSIDFVPQWYAVHIQLLRLIEKIVEPIRQYNYLESYDIIMTNSKYTKEWLKKLWKTDSHVVYPIIDTQALANTTEKKNIILSVGRFFAGGHNKKHLVMIDTFKKMFLEGHTGDWEYHLCGGTHPEKEHQEYLEQVQYEALGYPITIHPDIPFDELKQLYADATIFWHASGFGENEKDHPDRFEHFGITTVEAMSAGCIPIVIGKAGQKEIVQNNENGYLWETVAECKQKTIAIMNQSPKEREKIKEQAIITSTQYDAAACHAHLDTIFKEILSS